MTAQAPTPVPAPPTSTRAIADDALAPEARLAAGFAAHVERWARARCDDPAAVRLARDAAFAVSRATDEGHVCIAIGEIVNAGDVPDDDSARRRLLASGVVGTPAAPGAMPLILDDQDRLYLHRHFDHERRLARRLAAARRAPPVAIDAVLGERLDTLFGATGHRAADWQRLAATLALRQRLTVISGGPGTGKTTTVVNLLACLLTQDPQCRIALCAPTGKAAARMTEAIRRRARNLPDAVRDRLPAEAFTVHRLLGVAPGARGFVHHAARPLAVDALVVDEASMLDLALATRLLEAVPASARIVLLGDKDQLAAVEAGAVFAELSVDPSLGDDTRRALASSCGLSPQDIAPPAITRPSPLRDTAVWLTRNYRFAADSAIGRLAADIQAGRADGALATLRSATSGGVRWIDDAGAVPDEATLSSLVDGFATYLDTLRRDPRDVGAVSEAFGRFRVLCALRDGTRGVRALNDTISAHLRTALRPLADTLSLPAGSPWFAGRAVMVLRNDPLRRLFNGDVGIALPDDQGALAVHFPDAGGGFRALSPLRLPEHETAFAMTVHKSQGSEFDRVVVVLPRPRSRALTRELLYTAVTRARDAVTLCGSAEVIEAAVAAPTQRRSGLLDRLREAFDEAGSEG